MKNALTQAQADLLYGMLTQRLYLREGDPERDLVRETRDQLYPLTSAAAETAEALEVLEGHPVFAALSPEARETVARNEPTRQSWLGGQTVNFGPAEEEQKPLDYDAETAAKTEGTVVWYGADGEVYAKAAPGLVPVRWDGVTGTWYDVEFQSLGGGNPHTLDGFYRKEARMEETITVRVDEIRAGDRFVSEGRVYWTAVADAETYDEATDATCVEVQHADGGRDQRVWDDSATTLEVIRKEAV